VIDWVVANRQPISAEVARRYRQHGAEQVASISPRYKTLVIA